MVPVKDPVLPTGTSSRGRVWGEGILCQLNSLKANKQLCSLRRCPHVGHVDTKIYWCSLEVYINTSCPLLGEAEHTWHVGEYSQLCKETSYFYEFI